MAVSVLVVCAALTGCQEQIDPRDEGGITGGDSLAPSRWEGNPGGYGAAVLEFFSAETMRFEGSEYRYNYHAAKREGQIGAFGFFTIDAGETTMNFPQWRGYPHSAEFTKID